MLSIRHLFEFQQWPEDRFYMKGPRGRGYGRGGTKINAPMFAWSVFHGKKAPFIPGNTDWHSKVRINTPAGVWNIDSEIPIKPLFKLNEIKGIIVRASCQGHPAIDSYPEMNTYVIFKPENQGINYVKELVNKLNSNKNIKAGFGRGTFDKFRVAVVAPFHYDSNPKEFKKWWERLPNIIKKVL